MSWSPDQSLKFAAMRPAVDLLAAVSLDHPEVIQPFLDALEGADLDHSSGTMRRGCAWRT